MDRLSLVSFLLILAASGCHHNPDRARIAEVDRQLNSVVAILSTSPESAMYAHCIDYPNIIAKAKPVRTPSARAEISRYAHLCSHEVPLAVLKKFVPVTDPKDNCITAEGAIALLAPELRAGQAGTIASVEAVCKRVKQPGPAASPTPAPSVKPSLYK